jgi:hypothetical protein
MKKFFTKLFSDNNDINEKSVVGFLAFLMMVVTLGVDIYTGVQGKVMPINEFVFNGFMVITLGSFGIASVDKWTVMKNQKSSDETTDITE